MVSSESPFSTGMSLWGWKGGVLKSRYMKMQCYCWRKWTHFVIITYINWFSHFCDQNAWQRQRTERRVLFGSQSEGRQLTLQGRHLAGVWGLCSQEAQTDILVLHPLSFLLSLEPTIGVAHFSLVTLFWKQSQRDMYRSVSMVIVNPLKWRLTIIASLNIFFGISVHKEN